MNYLRDVCRWHRRDTQHGAVAIARVATPDVGPLRHVDDLAARHEWASPIAPASQTTPRRRQRERERASQWRMPASSARTTPPGGHTFPALRDQLEPRRGGSASPGPVFGNVTRDEPAQVGLFGPPTGRQKTVLGTLGSGLARLPLARQEDASASRRCRTRRDRPSAPATAEPCVRQVDDARSSRPSRSAPDVASRSRGGPPCQSRHRAVASSRS